MHAFFSSSIIKMAVGHLTVLLLVIVITQVTSTEYYIILTSGSCPPGQTCHTIDILANQSKEYLTSDTVLYFVEGTHILEERQLVLVDDVSNLTLKGLGSMEQGFHETMMVSTVVVQCVNGGGFAFNGSNDVTIEGITFKDCGADATEANVYYFDFRVTLIFSYVANVTLESVSVLNGTGMGLICSNCFDLYISDSSFALNHVMPNCNDFLCPGGNAYIQFFNSLGPFSYLNETVFSIEIVQSNFSLGVSAYYGISGGLTISKASSGNYFYGLDIVLDTVVLYSNTAVNGPNLYIGFSQVPTILYSIFITDTISTFGQPYRFPQFSEVAVTGGGMFFLDQATDHVRGSITIERSQFINNYVHSYGGMSVGWLGGVQATSLNITDTVFGNNSGNVGSGLYVYASGSLLQPAPVVTLTDVTIIGNKPYQLDDNLLGAINFQNLNVSAKQLNVTGNYVTGIVSLATIMTLSGNNSFVCNTGYNGGALGLYESSYILLRGGTYVSFIENIAYDRGGAIYVSQIVHVGAMASSCFFQLVNLRERNAEFYFRGNGAEITGNVLYGGNVQRCYSDIAFRDLFNYTAETEPIQIASDATQVCFCDSDTRLPDCNRRFETASVAPGEPFSVRLVGVGQYDGGTPAVLRLTDYTNGFPTSYLSNIIAECDATPTTYTIRIDDSSQTTSQVYFTLQDTIHPMEDNEAKILNITILPCPAGFSLDPGTGTCVCEGVLMAVPGVVCDLSKQAMSRSGSVWMGYLNESGCTIVREDCPYDYCNTSNITFNIESPDPQCALNRAGIMCGECREGYSLLLGSNKCDVCSNTYISLILPFALAGVALVVFLFVLDMTVSSGTINGLILYANLVKINEDAFLPDGPIPVLSQFVAWINLDFGIETCFFDGMTPVAKGWLFYAFPLYIWLLMIVLVVVAERSHKVAKLLGNNIIPVLGTLILLAMTKIYRAALNALSATTFVCNSVTTIAWYIDPNIEYNSPGHLLLTILSFVLVLLTLPFVLSLLFSRFTMQGLQKLTRCSRLRLGIRTFIDAYNAPYKHSYTTFWTGLTLMVRVVSVFSVAFSPASVSNAIIGLMMAVLLSLMAVLKGVYKNHLNLLEVWFLFHVLVITIFTAYGAAQITTGVSLALALLTFVGIIVYHIARRIRMTKNGGELEEMMMQKIKNRKSAVEPEHDSNMASEKDFVRTSSVDITSLRRRETLLDDTLVGNSNACSHHLAN